MFIVVGEDFCFTNTCSCRASFFRKVCKRRIISSWKLRRQVSWILSGRHRLSFLTVEFFVFSLFFFYRPSVCSYMRRDREKIVCFSWSRLSHFDKFRFLLIFNLNCLNTLLTGCLPDKFPSLVNFSLKIFLRVLSKVHTRVKMPFCIGGSWILQGFTAAGSVFALGSWRFRKENLALDPLVFVKLFWIR